MTPEKARRLVSKIFGEETAQDPEIVDFYYQICKNTPAFEKEDACEELLSLKKNLLHPHDTQTAAYNKGVNDCIAKLRTL